MKVKRALISVSDKTGLVEFARGLAELGVELISTRRHGARRWRRPGLPVDPRRGADRRRRRCSAAASRRCTRRSTAASSPAAATRTTCAALAEHGIEPIDLVVVNLYPFRAVAAAARGAEAEVIENIDIGGPAMVRAAAKNYARGRACVTDPERYGFVLDELRDGGGRALRRDTRRDLAAEAFAHTAGYDAAIANWFSDTESFPERHRCSSSSRSADLAYGENPHQRAAYYVETRRAPPPALAGRAARRQGALVQQPARPRRRARAGRGVPAAGLRDRQARQPVRRRGRRDAWRRPTRGRWRAIPVSAFGGVIAVNRPVSAELARAARASSSSRCCSRRATTRRRLDALARSANLRCSSTASGARPARASATCGACCGGMLVQDRDTESEDRDAMQVVSGRARRPSASGATCCSPGGSCKHVRSNAIVIARDLATVGIGAGQMSRVDSVRLALEKAGARGRAGAVLASDAFFPFADGAAGRARRRRAARSSSRAARSATTR